MTITVKLEPLLEERLRQRAASTDTSASDVIRAALQAYLEAPGLAPALSAHAIGQGLFGRHRGGTNLASDRKRALADVWVDKHRTRG